MFCKRESDGIDWYAYSRNPETFKPGSVKITLYDVGSALLTQQVYFDASFVFPQNTRLVEVVGFAGEKPHNEFQRKFFDLETMTFNEAVPTPPQKIIAKADIWRRATDEEADTILYILSQQTTRKRRIFNDATYIDHTDSMFAEMLQALTAAFGEARAVELLAPSDMLSG
ncbi:hypothetical protein FV229_08410 [Methylobacterium sp. WL120]|nr:hypothetical protein FV229_08410 [Methylobacterium sp. WL120]